MTWRWLVVCLLFAGLAKAQGGPGSDVLRRAVELHQAGHYAEAITGYQAYLKTHPDAAAVRSNLGAALIHEGRYDEAVEEYKHALEAQPSNYGIRLNLGLAYYKMGEIGLAIKEFELLHAAQKPDDPERERLRLLLAGCYLADGENDRVVALLDPLAEKDPNNLTVSYMLGTALIRTGQEKRGALIIHNLLQHGDTAEVHMLMAYTLMGTNNKNGALEEISRALALNPDLPEAYTLRGRLDFIVTNLQGAEKSFRKALELDPNSFEALLFLGAMFRQQGRVEQAEPLLLRALRIQPKEIRIRYQVALLYSAQGDDQRAAAVLRDLIKDVPEYLEAHRSLATIAFRLGLVEEGRKEMKIAKELDAKVQEQDITFGRSLKK